MQKSSQVYNKIMGQFDGSEEDRQNKCIIQTQERFFVNTVKVNQWWKLPKQFKPRSTSPQSPVSFKTTSRTTVTTMAATRRENDVKIIKYNPGKTNCYSPKMNQGSRSPEREVFPIKKEIESNKFDIKSNITCITLCEKNLAICSSLGNLIQFTADTESEKI